MLGLASLPIDEHLLAYWGFDEANANDVGLDRSSYANTLTFPNAATPVPGKVGNARTFDGASVYATAANSSFIAQASHLTLLTWATLESVKTDGSMIRTIVACDGPDDSTPRQNTVFALGVDKDGAITYRHDTNVAEPVVLKSAPGTFKTGHFYFLGIVRTYNEDGNVLVTLLLNGKVLPWASATINGVAQPDASAAMPPPSGGEDATVRVGVSQKLGDDFWHGLIDETSIHDIERVVSPYITGAYLKTALLTNVTRLTDAHTIKGLGVANLNDGGRWWVYERDQNCYAIRESALGTFEQETQLTTAGTAANGAPLPGSVSQPRLAYDSVNDVLVVAFVAAGRVFKFTGQITDKPGTLNMPYTADTATIIKMRDSVDAFTQGGGGAAPADPEAGMAATLAGSPGVVFYTGDAADDFGLFIGGANPHGYRVYRVIGAHEEAISDATERMDVGFPLYRFPLTQRVYGAAYRVRPLWENGDVVNDEASTGKDRKGDPVLRDFATILDVNDAGDLASDVNESFAGGGFAQADSMQFSSVVPIKFGGIIDAFDTDTGGGGFSAGSDGITQASTVPFKMSLSDDLPNPPTGGGGTALTFLFNGQTVTM